MGPLVIAIVLWFSCFFFGHPFLGTFLALTVVYFRFTIDWG